MATQNKAVKGQGFAKGQDLQHYEITFHTRHQQSPLAALGPDSAAARAPLDEFDARKEPLVSSRGLWKGDLTKITQGPTLESNWLIPGRLMTGAIPVSYSDRLQGESQLVSMVRIIEAGATVFVNLTTSGDEQDYEWQGGCDGGVVRDYKVALGDAVDLTGRHIRYMKFDVTDCSICKDEFEDQVSDNIARVIRDGETVYMHCISGRGRTGTLAPIVLGKLYGLSGAAAVKEFNICRAAGRRGATSFGPAPEDPKQVAQINRLLVHASKKP